MRVFVIVYALAVACGGPTEPRQRRLAMGEECVAATDACEDDTNCGVAFFGVVNGVALFCECPQAAASQTYCLRVCPARACAQ